MATVINIRPAMTMEQLQRMSQRNDLTLREWADMCKEHGYRVTGGWDQRANAPELMRMQ